MKTFQFCFLLTAITLTASQGRLLAQIVATTVAFGSAQELPLYPGVAPGSEDWDYSERIIEGKSGPQIKDVVRPSLLYFPAAHSVGTAMIVAPGGGNRTLMMSYSEEPPMSHGCCNIQRSPDADWLLIFPSIRQSK